MAKDDAFFEPLRANEFARLDPDGVAFLDSVGSGEYAESHLRAHQENLHAGGQRIKAPGSLRTAVVSPRPPRLILPVVDRQRHCSFRFREDRQNSRQRQLNNRGHILRCLALQETSAKDKGVARCHSV
jgi:hypothetical protein